MSEAQKRAYVLADNQLALNAGWDEALLRLELTDLETLGFDLGLIGSGEGELERLLAGNSREGLTDDDAAPDRRGGEDVLGGEPDPGGAAADRAQGLALVGGALRRGPRGGGRAASC